MREQKPRAEAAQSTPAQAVARDWPVIERFVSDYVEDYDFSDGESCDYRPNENERVLIADAIQGLLSDNEFIAMLAAAPQPDRTESVAAQGEDDEVVQAFMEFRARVEHEDGHSPNQVESWIAGVEWHASQSEAHQGAEPVVAGKGSTHWYACPHCDKPIDPPTAPDAREALERAADWLEDILAHIPAELTSYGEGNRHAYREALGIVRDALITPTPSAPTGGETQPAPSSRDRFEAWVESWPAWRRASLLKYSWTGWQAGARAAFEVAAQLVDDAGNSIQNKIISRDIRALATTQGTAGQVTG